MRCAPVVHCLLLVPSLLLAATAGAQTTYDPAADHSPLSPAVVARLREIQAEGRRRGRSERVFIKVGASMTVSRHFLHPFAGDDVRLGEHRGLAATIDWFDVPVAGGTTPFDRESLAATVGWSTRHLLAGDPCPVDREIEALSPAFAVVTVGTNNIPGGDVDRYATELARLVERLAGAGVVPLLSTVPPLPKSEAMLRATPDFNLAIFAVGQRARVPVMNLYSRVVDLEDFGIGSDRIHPNVHADATGRHAGWLTPEALARGYNVRNLVTLEALDRVRRVLVEDGRPDPEPDRPTGRGTPDDPIVVGSLPFVADGDTSTAPSRAFDRYAGADQDESGPEVVYLIEVARPTRLRAIVLDEAGVDVDVHVLSGRRPSSCTARDDRVVELDLEPGVHRVVVDTFVAGGKARAGRYLLLLRAVADPPRRR